MAPADPEHHRQRSIAATQEIASVVREIRELVAVPWAERDERWQARRTALDARKAALVAECQDIATMRARPEPDPPSRVTPEHRGPADTREVPR
jgi:hypothetical protein